MGLGTRAAVDLLGLRDTLLRRAKWGPLLVAMGRTSQVSATGLTPFAFPNVGLFMTFLETNGKSWHSFPNTASKLSLRDDGQWAEGQDSHSVSLPHPFVLISVPQHPHLHRLPVATITMTKDLAV